jgi:hypothetical protein
MEHRDVGGLLESDETLGERRAISKASRDGANALSVYVVCPRAGILTFGESWKLEVGGVIR